MILKTSSLTYPRWTVKKMWTFLAGLQVDSCQETSGFLNAILVLSFILGNRGVGDSSDPLSHCCPHGKV